MPAKSPALPFGGAYSRRFTRYAGFYFDEFDPNSAWIREEGLIDLPPMDDVDALVIRGSFLSQADAGMFEKSLPGLEVRVNGDLAACVPASKGKWEVTVPLPSARDSAVDLSLRLKGVGLTNALAWLGRVTGLPFLQRFRKQRKNRSLRVELISAAGERVYDFSKRESPFCATFARRHARLGMNIVGFLTADLGIGESARCMVRAADAAGIPNALVALKLNCKNRLGDTTYSARLQEDNPHPVNVIHIDPPAARDIDHHHGQAFRTGKFNIGYFAWELPEYPDAWLSAFDTFDEVWCPSDFTTSAISLKSPIPVLTMPHSMAFQRPAQDKASLRARLGLPPAPFLFLSLFDLNSYTERKNPEGAIEAFTRSKLGDRCVLVVKVQNAEGNPEEFARLSEQVKGRPDILLLSQTLSRADVYALEAACDALVSLHRSEGFGLVIAECMYLGLPVIATNWSATAEYLHSENGCPVTCSVQTLQENHGPYFKGSTWANPDLDHAAQWMRRLVEDAALGRRLGAAAKASIEERLSPAIVGRRYRARLEAIASG